MHGVSIGHGAGVFLGGASGGGAPVTPLTIVDPSAVLSWHRADLGYTIVTGVSQWLDQSGHSIDYVQATGANQPAFEAAGGPNGTASILFDGSNDLLAESLLDFPSPTTRPTLIWAVMTQVSWAANDTFFGANSATLAGLVYQITASPQVALYSGSNSTTTSALTLNTPFRAYWYFDNVGDNRSKVGSTVVTTTGTVGTNSATGRTIGGRQAANFANMRIMELLYMNRDFTGSEEADLDAYVSARYGAGLV